MTGVRAVAMFAVTLTAILLSTVVMPLIAVNGWYPDIVALTVVAFALAEGPATGMKYGFAAGIVLDLVAGPAHVVGLSALVLVALGYTIGILRPYLSATAPSSQVMAGGAGVALSVLSYGVLSALLDNVGGDPLGILQATVGTGLYSGLVAPLVIRPILRLAEQIPQTTVVRA